MKKIAVVLYNLGGPDSKGSIKPFLKNFFMDKNIIGAPLPIRFLLANYISWKRSRREAGDSYRELGDKSPLLENTRLQATALEEVLNKNGKDQIFKTFVCMRYWHPMAPQIVQDIKDWNADQIIQLPLYPQFSTTTTWSSFEDWNKATGSSGYNIPTSTICCYPENEGFAQISAANIASDYKKALADGHDSPRVLFSAHGLPEKIINSGDPYQYQCEQTAKKIADKLAADLDIDNLDWQICYQSRVGPLKWIGPSVEEALQKAASDNKPVIIYPHAFTQEHVETLVELDIEYRHLADQLGLPGYYRAQTVGTGPAFITALARLVNDHLDKVEISAEGHKCLCPENFTRCCMRKSEDIKMKKAA